MTYPTVDQLAQVIRTVDGENTMGAGALAEAILSALEPAPDAATSEAPMLRPIDKLSERIGCTALIRMKRLREQADWLEAHGDGSLVGLTKISDKREHADLIEEIHRLSNLDFSHPAPAARQEARRAGIEAAAKVAQHYKSFPQPTSRAARYHELNLKHTIAAAIRALAEKGSDHEA